MSKIDYKLRIQKTDGKNYLKEPNNFVVENIIPYLQTHYAKLYDFENLDQKVAFLDEILSEILKRAIKERIYKYAPLKQSFRLANYRWLLNIPYSYHDIFIEVFHELIAENKIEDRGSGWYRKKENKKDG